MDHRLLKYTGFPRVWYAWVFKMDNEGVAIHLFDTALPWSPPRMCNWRCPHPHCTSHYFGIPPSNTRLCLTRETEKVELFVISPVVQWSKRQWSQRYLTPWAIVWKFFIWLCKSRVQILILKVLRDFHMLSRMYWGQHNVKVMCANWGCLLPTSFIWDRGMNE